jgi:hypothetical protein
LFLDPKLLNSSAVRLVLWWNSLNKIFFFLFWVEICMGGTPKTQNLENLAILEYLYGNFSKNVFLEYSEYKVL